HGGRDCTARRGGGLDAGARVTHSQRERPATSLGNRRAQEAEPTAGESGALSYGVVDGWEQLPTGYAHRDVAGVAVDGEDRVFLICRGDHPIIRYDQKGNFLSSWGEGQFTYRTHGITIGPNGTVWCTD